MTVLGIDLAAAPKKTYACRLAEHAGVLRAELHADCDDDSLRFLADGCKKVAIDAPFGWPSAFVDAVDAHRRFAAWPAPDDEAPETFRAELSFRASDRVTMHTRRPLSVSTDRIGVTAMRCAHLLHRWARDGERVDRAGAGKFVEVYPAAALIRWGQVGFGYKGSDKAPLEALVAAIADTVPSLELSAEDRALCARADDAFDALVAALVARAATLGLTDLPPRALRGLAAKEGWIHLPLRGSLPLIGPASSHTHRRPADALAGRLAELGVAVTDGYASHLDDVVLPWFSDDLRAAIRADLSGKGGSELEPRRSAPPKFHAAYSSAGLAANAFAPWLSRREAVPFGDESFPGEVHLEVERSTGLRGTPPTLDCLVDGQRALAIESKCTEQFSAHEASFQPAYAELAAGIAHRSWREEYERLVEDPRRYRFLDAAQLVKHYLGLKTQFGDRDVTLAYLYWEPVNADQVPECVIHRAEARAFAAVVDDPHVRFRPMSYADLWTGWDSQAAPWLREHVAALRKRYAVAL